MPIAVPERGSGPRKTGCPSPKKGRRTTVISPRAPFSLPDFPGNVVPFRFSPLRRHAFRAVPLLPSTSPFPGCGFPSQCFLRHRSSLRHPLFPGHRFQTLFFSPCPGRTFAQVASGNSVMRSVVQPGDQRDLFGGLAVVGAYGWGRRSPGRAPIRRVPAPARP